MKLLTTSFSDTQKTRAAGSRTHRACRSGTRLTSRLFTLGTCSRKSQRGQVVNVLKDQASYVTPSGVVDYYEILGVDDDASPQEIKAAYRALAKICHPDFTGDRGHNMCILLNEAYSVLMDDQQRTIYDQQLDTALQDEEDGYTGELLSKWLANTKMGKNADPKETRAVFVDEIRCIGCKQCMHISPATYRMEDAHGRSRVFAQWLDTEDNLQASMDCCPVSCIHWVDKADLPALEYVMRNRTSRPNVAVMMSGQGGAVQDVWDSTAKYLKERAAREEKRKAAARYSAAQEAARRQAAADLRAQQSQGGWWDGIFSKLAMEQAAKVMAEAFKEQVRGTVGQDGERGRVGTRKRGNRWATAATGAGGGIRRGPVPLERSLVPLSVKSEPWRKG